MIPWLLACSAWWAPDHGVPEAPGARAVATVVKPAQHDARWVNARCNDGTPFAYVIRGGDPDLWVIHLRGGHFCDDRTARCADRRPRLTTTVPEADGAVVPLRRQGLFSPQPSQNPAFHSATVVDAHYCSSDLWLGDQTDRRPTTGDPEQGWYFSGRANVEALFGSLVADHGLDDGSARVLVVGSSAGGAGVVGNLPTIVARLPRSAADGRLKVLLDGSWVPEQPPERAMPNATAWGPMLPGCDQGARCAYGDVWWPHVEALGVPVLVQQSGLDPTQTSVFSVRGADAEVRWLERAQASLERVPWVYSHAEPYHLLALDPGWHEAPAGAPTEQSFRAVLGRFWSGAPPEQHFLGYAVAPVNGGTPGR